MGLLFALLPKKTFSETEKRNLASFPSFSFSALADGSFTRDFEVYLSDHTPFRSFFVALNAYTDLALGDNGSNGVYAGRHGWLFEKPFARENRFETNTQRILAFAGRISVPCTVLPVPTKGSVYTEELPKNHLQYFDNEEISSAQKRFEQNGVSFVNLQAAFSAHKGDRPLYYRTDHHWTSFGACIAYNELSKTLGFSPLAESEFSVEKTENFYGTSYARSGYFFTKPDTLEIYRNKKTNGQATVTITENGKESTRDNLFFTENRTGGDAYTVFLGGNHALETIRTGHSGGRLLVIKDSFAHCLVPFLAAHYSEIVTVDLRYYKKPVSALLTEKNFDRVLFVYGADTLAESKDIILR